MGHLSVEGISIIRSRNGDRSRRECVLNDQTTKASNKGVRRPLPPPFPLTCSSRDIRSLDARCFTPPLFLAFPLRFAVQR